MLAWAWLVEDALAASRQGWDGVYYILVYKTLKG